MPYLEAAVAIAREAGGVLLEHLRKGIGFELKGDFDLVTAADKASEALVIERLTARFPEHGIIAEEGGGHTSDSEFRWYVDPLDGTTNFAHGYPMFNVTLALERGDQMIAGVIYDPLRDEMFRAAHSAGAFLNDQPISVSRASRLEDSLVSTGFPSHNRARNFNIHFYHQLAMSTHGVRRGGSAAIDLAYVACGRLDAFWEFGLKPWDLAAGKLIVTEAGGTVTQMKGERHEIASPDLLATNGSIHQETLDRFGDIFRGDLEHPIPPLPAD